MVLSVRAQVLCYRGMLQDRSDWQYDDMVAFEVLINEEQNRKGKTEEM
jgi:hypothetical protein